ncbi:uncharacterized protein [Montipora foliosa]|uniref:uncharacterized protein n=1 Tax=Montipora foliosa TaxID=591990 RepID=UPI0035F123C1
MSKDYADVPYGTLPWQGGFKVKDALRNLTTCGCVPKSVAKDCSRSIHLQEQGVSCDSLIQIQLLGNRPPVQHQIKSSTVIKKLKAHLARYDIPKQLVTDNDPQFISDKFRKFTESWGIKHTTTSPHHSQVNGKCELALKVAKRMLRKATKSGEDQYLAMLNIRNVPTQGVDRSPVQRLLGRRTRTLIPITQSLLEPSNPVSPHESVLLLSSNQGRQAKYYNRTGRNLPILIPDETVHLKPFALRQKSWDKAQVTKRLGERSFEV